MRQQVLIEAEAIRNKREQEVLSGKFLGETSGINTPFLPYYRSLVA